MIFKILCPGGYSVKDIDNDNIDVHVALKNGDVYFATLFTLSNIHKLMLKENSGYFWAADMIIVEKLDIESIKRAIRQMVNDGYLEMAFDKIGNIQEIYPGSTSFEQLKGL